ncbi:hypothetical protein [Hellea balneolensis]|uniref:hypothetical protein n=1 Tax=Hellea balneolensis TaxID=287478 RepID=UPI00041D16B2|nr:hypothetical protein [Hellea balneolensis]
MKNLLLTSAIILVAACSPAEQVTTEEPVKAEAVEYSLNQAGEDFVKLALRMGQVDSDYVDAYSGPKDWREAIKDTQVDPANLTKDIEDLRRRIGILDIEPSEDIRRKNLMKLLRAMAVRLDVVTGKPVSFDKEVSDIYDVKPPRYDLSDYDAVLAELDAIVPGDGSVAEQVNNFRNKFAIPKDKLKPVFDRAIAECRARTSVYFELPETEKFTMEFVTDKSWSGYNYYQGNYESLIQINTDFPITIDRAVDLGCHEGYPGHHVWNLFIERELVRKRDWIEYSVNPLFGPFGPLAEGSGNFGIGLAFPGEEKMAFEKEVLFPMAGLDTSEAELFERVLKLESQLSHATNDIARRYLDGDLTKDEAVPLIQKYYLQSREKSEQRLRFIEKYRGYVINYNIGQDIVRSYVQDAGDTPEAQWTAFRDMLTIPLTPGDLQKR